VFKIAWQFQKYILILIVSGMQEYRRFEKALSCALKRLARNRTSDPVEQLARELLGSF
jgi:hypothetical protein